VISQNICADLTFGLLDQLEISLALDRAVMAGSG
jgi:hypothetical protein